MSGGFDNRLTALKGQPFEYNGAEMRSPKDTPIDTNEGEHQAQGLVIALAALLLELSSVSGVLHTFAGLFRIIVALQWVLVVMDSRYRVFCRDIG